MLGQLSILGGGLESCFITHGEVNSNWRSIQKMENIKLMRKHIGKYL